MRSKNNSRKWEFQLRAGAGFRGFEKSGCKNRVGLEAGNGITIFYVY